MLACTVLYGSATSPGRFNGGAKQIQPGSPTRQGLTSAYQSYEAEEYDYQLGASAERAAGATLASSNDSETGGLGFSGRPLTACGAWIPPALLFSLSMTCVSWADLWLCCGVRIVQATAALTKTDEQG